MLKAGVLVFSYQALCLNRVGDVHQSFQSLLKEMIKSSTQCLLRTANRLFGEKTCDYLPVSRACSLMKRKQKNYHRAEIKYSSTALNMCLEIHF